jgi:predicted permease
LSPGLLQMLSPVFAAFGLVLAAACANVSNVMLARAHTRHREIGVRLAIGASRWRLVRQLLTEGLLLAILSGLAGLALASVLLRVGITLFLALLPSSVAAVVRVVSFDLDHRVFLFTLAGAGLATLCFALAPALQATRLTLTDAMRGGANAGLRGTRLRNTFVATQVAVSLVILVAATTLIRNSAALATARLGLDTDSIVAIKPTSTGEALIARATVALLADSRVARLAVASRRPLSEDVRAVSARPTGPRAASSTRTPYTFVSPPYFSTLGIAIVRGRTFDEGEARVDAPVAIVSAAMARAFWPDLDPLGQTVRIERANGQPVDDLSGYSDVLVVGVAADVVSSLVMAGEDRAHLYLPTNAASTHARAIVVRGRGRHELGRDTLRAALLAVHPDPLAFDALPLEEAMALQLFPFRVSGWIGYVLGAIALALAVSGLYGVLSYTMSQRRVEMAIRIALGATRAAILRLVMHETMRLVGFGALVGGFVALAVMSALAAAIELRNVSFVDAGAFGLAFAVVAAAAATAAWAPARRAASADPARTLRPDA